MLAPTRLSEGTDILQTVLYRDILTGEAVARALLAARETADRFDISPAQAREVLEWLMRVGLLQKQTDESFAVVKVDAEDLAWACQTRLRLEGKAAIRLLRIDRLHLARLQAVNEEINRRIGDCDEKLLQFILLDYQFHQELLLSANLFVAREEAELIRAFHYLILGTPSVRKRERRQEIYTEHQRILQTIEQHDRTRLALVLLDHFHWAIPRHFPQIKVQPDLQAPELDGLYADLFGALRDVGDLFSNLGSGAFWFVSFQVQPLEMLQTAWDWLGSKVCQAVREAYLVYQWASRECLEEWCRYLHVPTHLFDTDLEAEFAPTRNGLPGTPAFPWPKSRSRFAFSAMTIRRRSTGIRRPRTRCLFSPTERNA